eukprot:360645_1
MCIALKSQHAAINRVKLCGAESEGHYNWYCTSESAFSYLTVPLIWRVSSYVTVVRIQKQKEDDHDQIITGRTARIDPMDLYADQYRESKGLSCNSAQTFLG